VIESANVKRILTISAGCALALTLYFRAEAQQSTDVVWAPKPVEATKYVPPHKPITRLADLKKRNEGKKNWQELVVNDDYLRGEWIYSAAGTKLSKRMHPDTRTWWIVMDGEMKVDIEGQKPFVARKGYIVNVPLQTFYTAETTGDKPSLRFEVNIAGAKTLYAKDAEPPKMPGIDWLPVRVARRPSVYDRGNEPYKTFDQLAENVEKHNAPVTQRVVEDDRGVANFIYGYESKLPPLNLKDRGHYHPECAEFWLIMAGQIRYPIEHQGVIIADAGDVVYVPKLTFHAPRFYGKGPSCRLAMNGYPNIAHLFDAVKQ
jgi:mannose-6-phosphate isomerase-like protein (cupin superfamily)